MSAASSVRLFVRSFRQRPAVPKKAGFVVSAVEAIGMICCLEMPCVHAMDLPVLT